MKVRQIMTNSAVSVGAGENVEVAARTLHRYNIGALPVCGSDGKLCGMVTDRDLVLRCVAAGKQPGQTPVRDVMTRRVISVTPETSVEEARSLMAQSQVRRLPVTENGRLCGILSLGDLATHGADGQALAQISAQDL